MMSTPIDLDHLLRRLHLPTVRRLYSELAAKAEEADMSYRDFLAILMAEEVAHRGQTRIQRAVRQAHFPFLGTIEEFDFLFQSSVKLSLLGSFLGPELMSEGRSLVLYGPSGLGKTHLAIAVAYRAIQNGGTALFREANALIEELSTASQRGTLRQALLPYVQTDVLVIDELGYLTYPQDAANVLFQVVNQRSLKRKAMVFTTNKPLERWAHVLHDRDLAEAITDRILERGRLIQLRGPSYRTRHLPKSREEQADNATDVTTPSELPRSGPLARGPERGTSSDPQPALPCSQDPERGDLSPEGRARISGIPGPNFPEPTSAGP